MKKIGLIGKYIGGVLVIVVMGLVVLRWSMKSYQLSQRREEVKIAQMGIGNAITFPEDGKVRFYYFSYPDGVRLIKLSYKGQVYEFKTNLIQSGQYIDTDIEVKSGDKMWVEAWEGVNLDLKTYGWKLISGDKMCDGRDASGDIKRVEDNGDKIIITQCWNDWENPANPNLDYNDFALIFAYPGKGESTPESSPEPSPESSPESSPEPSPESSPESSPEPSPEPSPESFTPSQPDTGVPTWLSLGSVVLVGVLVVVKAVLKI